MPYWNRRKKCKSKGKVTSPDYSMPSMHEWDNLGQQTHDFHPNSAGIYDPKSGAMEEETHGMHTPLKQSNTHSLGFGGGQRIQIQEESGF